MLSWFSLSHVWIFDQNCLRDCWFLGRKSQTWDNSIVSSKLILQILLVKNVCLHHLKIIMGKSNLSRVPDNSSDCMVISQSLLHSLNTCNSKDVRTNVEDKLTSPVRPVAPRIASFIFRFNSNLLFREPLCTTEHSTLCTRCTSPSCKQTLATGVVVYTVHLYSVCCYRKADWIGWKERCYSLNY